MKLPPRGEWRPAAKKAPAKKAAAKRAPRKAVPRVAPEPEWPDPEDRDAAEDERLDEARDAVIQGEIVEPAIDAWKDRLAGMPWWEIARKHNFVDEQSAVNAVAVAQRRARGERSAVARAEALHLQTERHERLVMAWWERAISYGDAAAAAIVSRELSALDKIHRLGEKDAEVDEQGRTVVIAASPEAYTAGLRAVVRGEPIAIEGNVEPAPEQ